MITIEQFEAANNSISTVKPEEWSFQDHFSLLCGVMIETLQELRAISEKIEGQTAMIARFFIKETPPAEPGEAPPNEADLIEQLKKEAPANG